MDRGTAMNRERIPLLFKGSNSDLSMFFTTLCMVDIFGVFPIIALPPAIVQCGLLGIPLVLIVFGLQIYTATLLGKSWMIATALDPQLSRKNRYPLAAVTELTLGSRARTVVTVFLDLTVFCGGIPNLLVASQNLQLFGLKVSERQFDLSFCYWLLLVGLLLCPLMWLGSPRDMKWLAMCSSAVVAVTAVLVWWCIITDDPISDFLPISASPTWDKFISGYGMLAFQFDVHPTLMTIQVDMRNPRHIYKPVIMSFLVSGLLFAVTAGLTAWKYGSGTTANILQIVPEGLAVRGAILLTALQLCFSSAIGHSALFLHLEDQLRVQRSFGWKRCALRSTVVFLGVAIGESVPRFDIVMALIGGSLIGPLVFVLPPLMYSRALGMKSDLMRSSTPEIYSASEKRLNLESDQSDPRIHSRSIYYGFLGFTKMKPYRYSYVYYNKRRDCNKEYIDLDDDEHTDTDGIINEPLITKCEEEDQPVLLDPSEPSFKLRREGNVEISHRRATQFWDVNKFVNLFGYFVVLIGIGITISSTYINIRNTIRYVRFTPPCIVNATTI